MQGWVPLLLPFFVQLQRLSANCAGQKHAPPVTCCCMAQDHAQLHAKKAVQAMSMHSQTGSSDTCLSWLQVVEANKFERRKAAGEAEVLLAEEQLSFEAWRDSLETVPTIKVCNRYRSLTHDKHSKHTCQMSSSSASGPGRTFRSLPTTKARFSWQSGWQSGCTAA